MPLYRFHCRACGGFDRAFAMADVPAAASCPVCAADSKRQFGGGALIRPGPAAAAEGPPPPRNPPHPPAGAAAPP
ncbi:FmdB family zinc ribbon protein, partial [Nocardia brasiliensis]|uniref:FmdB family zinc ribbon protein n=1 Tax=Nocardia brasiliensis TaxID=37326 RepID=UPI002455A933